MMRALTVRQPWATALVHGDEHAKNVENRPRRTHHNGPLLIHAGLRYDDGSRLDQQVIFWRLDTTRDGLLLRNRLERARSAVVGVVEVTGCHHASECGGCSPWAMTGRWHWQIGNPRPLDQPVSCRGALGLWTPPPQVLDAVLAQQLDPMDYGRKATTP